MVIFYLSRVSDVKKTLPFPLDSYKKYFTYFMIWTNIPLILIESFSKFQGSNYICEAGKA
jgi:hypothetical protein